MILENLAFEALIHEDTYVAMLRAALNRRGDKTRFAQQTKVVTREYLSNVTGKERQRRLSPRTADKIATNLSWSSEVRDAFVEHVQLGQQARLLRHEAVRQTLDDCDASSLLGRLHREFAIALSPEKPEMAGLHYRAVRDLCKDLLQSSHPSVHPRQSPLNYVEVCLMLCNAQGVLDRPDEALFYSKIASRLLAERDARSARSERARHESLRIAAMRAEASAYHIMDLPKMSFEISRQALNELRHGAFDPSEVHLIVTQLSALAKGRRFGILDARSLADAAHRAAEKLTTELEYQHQQVNIQRTLADAETRYGNAPRAVKVLQLLVEQSDTQLGGNVRRASLLRSYAQAQYELGDIRGFTETLRATLKLCLEAGLTHQIRQNQKAFGATTNRLLEELTSGHLSPSTY